MHYYDDFKNDIKSHRIYSEEEIDKYLTGLAVECEKIDHGIVGGLLLYDKLRSNFKKAQKENACTNLKSFDEFVNGRMLHYSTEHFPYYAEAADAIVAHNIWTDRLKRYIKVLSPGKEVDRLPRITFCCNRIAFILAITDTIEPLKRGRRYLSKVSIGRCYNKGGFSIQMDGDVFDERYCELPTLADWTEIDIKMYTNGSQKGATLTLPGI